MGKWERPTDEEDRRKYKERQDDKEDRPKDKEGTDNVVFTSSGMKADSPSA